MEESPRLGTPSNPVSRLASARRRITAASTRRENVSCYAALSWVSRPVTQWAARSSGNDNWRAVTAASLPSSRIPGGSPEPIGVTTAPGGSLPFVVCSAPSIRPSVRPSVRPRSTPFVRSSVRPFTSPSVLPPSAVRQPFVCQPSIAHLLTTAHPPPIRCAQTEARSDRR